MLQTITTIICALIAAAGGIASAVVGARVQKDRKTAEKREERRARESRLSMDMMYAACGLAMDTARAMREGHTNGTLEGDLEKAVAARSAYDAFVRDEAAHAVAKGS